MDGYEFGGSGKLGFPDGGIFLGRRKAGKGEGIRVEAWAGEDGGAGGRDHRGSAASCGGGGNGNGQKLGLSGPSGLCGPGAGQKSDHQHLYDTSAGAAVREGCADRSIAGAI